uniref:SDE2/SF3A3 SAP domain-containing protein n=1 Tax=Solanum lycopersicum TaxID=4081 RepID=A0A3Q7ELQ1_SOLLC
MSGRRLRHVNAEKKLEEWRAEAEERKLEKMADEFLKKNAKEAAKKDSNGEAEGSLDSVTGRKVDGGASESGSEEEKDTLLLKNLEPGKDVNVNAVHHESESLSSLTPDSPENTGQSAVASSVGTDIASVIESIQTEKEASGASEPIVVEGSSGVKENNAAKPSNNLSPISEPQEDAVSKDSELEKPLNFEQFSSAAELEVLGMEKLKSELQVRGLKCGGTLQERAARLFLLKTTPLEMLPKKLLAKK